MARKTSFVMLHDRWRRESPSRAVQIVREKVRVDPTWAKTLGFCKKVKVLVEKETRTVLTGTGLR